MRGLISFKTPFNSSFRCIFRSDNRVSLDRPVVAHIHIRYFSAKHNFRTVFQNRFGFEAFPQVFAKKFSKFQSFATESRTEQKQAPDAEETAEDTYDDDPDAKFKSQYFKTKPPRLIHPMGYDENMNYDWRVPLRPVWFGKNMFDHIIKAFWGFNLGFLYLWWLLYHKDNPRNVIIEDNFTVSSEGTKYGFWWSYVLSGFSHQSLTHLVFDMVLFNYLARPLVLIIRWHVLTCWIVSSIVASLSHVAYCRLTGTDRHSNMASPAMMGTLSCFLGINWWSTAKVMKLPMPHFLVPILVMGVAVNQPEKSHPATVASFVGPIAVGTLIARFLVFRKPF